MERILDILGYESREEYLAVRKKRNKIFELDMRFGLIDEATQDEGLDYGLETYFERRKEKTNKLSGAYKRIAEIEDQIASLLSERKSLGEFIAKHNDIERAIARDNEDKEELVLEI